MICRYCGTALPQGAMFCGECGRAVHSDESRSAPAPTSGLSIADLAFSSPGETSPAGDPDDRELPDGTPAHPAISATACAQCGEPMDDGDVFCGECGFVAKSATSVPPAEDPEFEVDSGSPPAPVLDRDGTTEVEPLSAEFEEFDAVAPAPDAAPDAVVAPAPHGGPVRARAIPDPFPWGAARTVPEDHEATRLVAGGGSGARFVLQFSTGESVTVTGSGLIGRNPSMQPGEYVDQLVPIFDAGKSVSKTHLEFGQEGGRFWVSDRYSTNGSVVRQPDAAPRRCDPGRRYFVGRGTRVDVGEQFFVVS